MKNLKVTCGVLLCVFGSAYLFAYEDSPKEAAMNLNNIDTELMESFPIQHRGRVKPFRAFSEQTLQTFYGRSSMQVSDNEKISAIKLLLDMWLQPQMWLDRKIILVNYSPLREELELDEKSKYGSFQQLASSPALRQKFMEIQQLKQRDTNAKLDRSQKEVESVMSRLNVIEELMNGSIYKVVSHPDEKFGAWTTVRESGVYYGKEKTEEITQAFDRMRDTYIDTNQVGFVNAVAELEKKLSELPQKKFVNNSLMKLELFYIHLKPYRWATVCFILGLLSLIVTSLAYKKQGYLIAWVIMSIGLVLQVFGLVARSVIAGRPPVSNMFETVIWVAFGVILLAFIFEAMYRCRYFLLGAAPVAVVSLILADTQPMILDSSINPLVPVLRSNFWLTIHVLTITSSYAAFALALGVGHVVLIGVLFGKKLTADLHKYLYRSLQIGVLLLAAGTILGGVWANYSWGRFWDWDPKETWALIALLSYLIVLHGRIAGWWAGFGLAIGSILCFMSVLMAWYGVNFVLGVGLHSYGFGTGGFPYVLGYVVLEIIFIAIVSVRYLVSQKISLKAVKG